jgi:hypothetical protein
MTGLGFICACPYGTGIGETPPMTLVFLARCNSDTICSCRGVSFGWTAAVVVLLSLCLWVCEYDSRVILPPFCPNDVVGVRFPLGVAVPVVEPFCVAFAASRRFLSKVGRKPLSTTPLTFLLSSHSSSSSSDSSDSEITTTSSFGLHNSVHSSFRGSIFSQVVDSARNMLEVPYEPGMRGDLELGEERREGATGAGL